MQLSIKERSELLRVRIKLLLCCVLKREDNMTVFELIRELSMCEPDSEVRIVVTDSNIAGATPSTGIRRRGVNNGFDWDNGRVLISTEDEIKKAT